MVDDNKLREKAPEMLELLIQLLDLFPHDGAPSLEWLDRDPRTEILEVLKGLV